MHINEVKKAIAYYTSGDPGSIAPNAHGKKTLQFREAPPSDIAVLAGEVLYQLRSTLDHLAFDLVQLNSGKIQLPASWVKRCEFPLLVDIPTQGNPPAPCTLPLPYNFFERSLPGIDKAAFMFIESVQPYYIGDGPSQLRAIAILSNIDKHRHLHVPKPEAQVRFDAIVDGYYSTTIIRTEADAEVEIPPEITPGTKVKAGFTPFVTLDESALGEGPTRLTADGLLEFCTDGIERLIVPAFEKFIQNL